MKKEDRSYEHLKKQANVKSMSLSTKAKLFIFIGLVLILLFIMMCFNLGSSSIKKSKLTQSTISNPAILNANADRIKALEKASLQKDITPLIQQTNNKALLARMNSPTQVYNATKPTMINKHINQASKLLTSKGGYSQFANSQSTTASLVNANKISHPDFTIPQGEFIHAELETAVNSDLPGMVRAIVSRPVYSYLGERCLIPAGSRLIGQYTSLAGNGTATERVFVIWNRVITPTGISVMLNSPGSDSLGRAGVGADSINTHFFKIFSSAALLSIMAATTASYQVGSFDQPNSANQYQQSIADSFQQAAKNSLQGNLQIKPTLLINQGTNITLFVAHDLNFYSVYKNNG